eukprot:1194711-Prorocentrum_minimum.AAC.4
MLALSTTALRPQLRQGQGHALKGDIAKSARGPARRGDGHVTRAFFKNLTGKKEKKSAGKKAKKDKKKKEVNVSLQVQKEWSLGKSFELQETCLNCHAISLPRWTFSPFGTGCLI